ncbi:hypothetical protein Taro_005402 [Colocasia esculenta]|uniref:Uncharacterized protein n=1 Tax=Colocasia esculenta TaxID=4460 RepID=A0A843TSW0_COLES|nr:hypothetical protein [Colocasia esculenta]
MAYVLNLQVYTAFVIDGVDTPIDGIKGIDLDIVPTHSEGPHSLLGLCIPMIPVLQRYHHARKPRAFQKKGI